MSFVRNRFERGTVAPAPVTSPLPVVPAANLPEDPDKLLEKQQAAAAAPAPVAPAPVAAPVVEPDAAPAPVELPEQRYEYQPEDENGKPMGGRQVIIYRTADELRDKLTKQNIELVRKLREVTRKQKLGITDDAVPEGAELAVFEAPKPRVLSAEERFQLSQDINDPEKSIDAINTILEASVGYTAEQMRQQFDDARIAKLQNQAFVNYKIFEQSASDFYPTADNAKLLTDWMFSKKLAPTVKNYEIAFSTLNGAGLLQPAPTVREVSPAPVAPAAPAAPVVAAPPAPVPVSTEPKPVVPAVEESRIAPQTPPQQERQPVRVPSGLNGRTSADSGPPSVRTSLTIAEFDKIPADELKKKLKDPQFAALVNELFTPKKPA